METKDFGIRTKHTTEVERAIAFDHVTQVPAYTLQAFYRKIVSTQ